MNMQPMVTSGVPPAPEVLYQMLQEPGMKGNYVEIPPRMATQEELELIHMPNYISLVASTRPAP